MNTTDWEAVIQAGPFLSITELQARFYTQRIIHELVKRNRSYGEITLGVLNFLHRAKFEGSRWASLWRYAEAYMDGYLDRCDAKDKGDGLKKPDTPLASARRD